MRQKTFDAAAPEYNEALRRRNFNTQLTYQPPSASSNTRRNRSQNVIWYNPPFSKNVKTNIAYNFLQLTDKHFPPNNKLSKFFTRHIVRESYSCNENMRSFISRHNKTILERHAKQTELTSTKDTRNCNCRQTGKCPIQGKCLQRSVISQAEVPTTDNETKTYVGVTANDFKARYRNHQKSFNNRRSQNETELSKHAWHLKDSKRIYDIKWGIVKRVAAGTRKCRLCLEEKLLILKGRKKNILNKRSELFVRSRACVANHYVIAGKCPVYPIFGDFGERRLRVR